MPRDVRFIPPSGYCYYCIDSTIDALGAEVVAGAANCTSGRVTLLLFFVFQTYPPRLRAYFRTEFFCERHSYFELLCDDGFRIQYLFDVSSTHFN